jgi:hypothetical protein
MLPKRRTDTLTSEEGRAKATSTLSHARARPERDPTRACARGPAPYLSTVPGHAQAGMKGVFTVR